MNNFHIYQAIGRGKHSTVYKGRKKKSLEYCAIKSVEKSQRTKVLQEVRALHSLDHPNILKFFHCYETSAHLWLVLEYCVGGDLMTLLRQDQRLPESSVHDLARDVVKALQFLHSKGIIYCDLKPSNILLDENGRVKLCDFGLARPLSDLSKNAVSMLPQTKRGTPCYMAPELFQDGGVHSFASDFWALGCILYECFVGRPPFYGNEFTQLVTSILGDELPPLPNNPSSSFSDLIERLLVKNPSERIQWSELCQHSFWRTKFAPVALPPQPDFNHMLRLYSQTCIPENNDDKSTPQRTPSKCHERGPTNAHKQDENCHSNAVGFTTPTKNAQGLKKTNKTVVRVDDKRKISNAAKNVNILRLSRMANLNLQRENEKENYRRPIPKSSENNVEVKIENNDMELDFSENPEDDAPDETDGPEDACTPDSNVSSHCQTNEADDDVDAHDINRGDSSVLPDDTIELQQDIPSDDKEISATPPSVNQHRKGHRVKAGTENAPELDTTKSENNIWQVLWHSSDLSVKPVMPNKKSDKASLTTPMLPFECPAASDYVKLPPEQLEELNGHISHSLGGPSQLSEKQNALRYVEMLSMNSEAANLLTNGPIMPLLVKMLRLSKTSTLRVQLASVIGLVIRHSTLIKPDLATSGIMNVLTDGLRDKQDKVRRFCMAALGELLFYISTQNDQEGSALESPLKDGRSTSGWQVPSSVVALVCSILRKGEDDTIQLYALRSIENVCSQGSEWTSRFSGQNMIGNMCYIYKAIGRQENTRLTAGSCLVRFARFSPSSISMVFERLSFREIASSLVKGNPREQQICLNLLIMAMLGNQTISNFNRHLVSLVEEKQLIPTVVSLIERGTEVLKGKTLIFIALLSKSSRRWLPHFFCNAKLLSAVDRLVKEKDSFIQQCIEFFVQLVASTVPGILEMVRGDIQQVMLSKRHGHISSPAVRANPKSTTHLFPVLLHLLGSLCFKHKLVTNQVLSQLANVMTLLVSPFQGRDDFQITLLQVLEIISEDHLSITQEPKIFTSQLLPGLAILYKGNKDPDARFLCLKVLFDVMIVLFNEFVPATATDDSSIKKDLKAISETHFLPLYPIFVEDEDPIPMYAQKLLVMLIEFNYVEVSDILNMKTVSQCFGFLLGDLSSANVSNVKLCLALASAPEMEANFLSQMRVVRKIGNILEFVNAKEMEDFLEPTLGLCKAFILHSVGINRGITYAREPAFLLDKTMDMQFAIMQNNIKDIADFSSNIGVFLELVGHDDPQVADLASECLVVLAKAAPRESTMGFLTNLAKINSVLQAMVGVSEPILLRVMYSLAFSCRNYLSQAMILSISVSDVQRIETIVSSFKGSNSTSIVTAAAVLASELQRLPRYT